MSVDVSMWVWKHANASGSALLIMLALADIANHDGVCWPSISTLAQRSRLHEQTVRGHLNDLREKGCIGVEAQPGRSNRYRILMEETPVNIATPSDLRRGTETTQSTPLVDIPLPGTEPLKANRKGTVKEPSEQKTTSKGTRLSADWQPAPGEVAYAVERAPSIVVAETVEDFVDYWVSKPGAGGVKLDWSRAWQQWVRKAHKWNVEKGWVAPAQVHSLPAAAGVDEARDRWLAERGVPLEEYLERKDESGWLASLDRHARKVS